MKHKEITQKIIEAYFKVYNNLGHGFLEKVYENAMVLEVGQMGLLVQQQQATNVYYKEQPVGVYIADLVVERKVICEIKAQETLVPANENQLLNYLKATEIEVSLLLNFGLIPQFKRKLLDNDRKPLLQSKTNP